jgi:hypothetical protein
MIGILTIHVCNAHDSKLAICRWWSNDDHVIGLCRALLTENNVEVFPTICERLEDAAGAGLSAAASLRSVPTRKRLGRTEA